MIEPDAIIGSQPTATIEMPEWGGTITLRRLKISEIAVFYDRWEGSSKTPMDQLTLFLDLIPPTIIEPRHDALKWRACLECLEPDRLRDLGAALLQLSDGVKKKTSTAATSGNVHSDCAGRSESRTQST